VKNLLKQIHAVELFVPQAELWPGKSLMVHGRLFYACGMDKTETTEHPPRLPSESIGATTHDGKQVIIRRWRSSDADAFHQAMHESFEHLQPWMPWAAAEPQLLDAHQAIVDRFSATWTHTTAIYGIFLEDRVIGGTGLHDRIGSTGWEIGYWVHPQFEGRGVISAVVGALTTEAFVERTDEVHAFQND
jgi:RimJ/RimL family protein N-acetyltransferase